ncbi:MAG: hypothetical protein LBC28_05120 [Oscillospiraceae bacterium]|jgi:hypothetical protein|nr:hypothetical protein [Oscillospiraceae bacterium]
MTTKVQLTPKENYLRMLRREEYQYVPSMLEPYMAGVTDELLTPQAAPNGPVVTGLGVTYVGSPDNGYGAMPKPGETLLSDVTKWRDVVKLPDLSGRDKEAYYKERSKHVDRSQTAVVTDGGDYFLTLAALMGFEGALLAMHEEPEEVRALLEHISTFYLEVTKDIFHYVKPDVYILMDDDAAYRAPFFSLETYRELIKPFHKLHCDIALENGAFINRHDCGKSEQFIDDWLELGVREWNPVQISNDCRAIKQKYCGRLALSGCWDSQGELGSKFVDKQKLRDALTEYVDTYAPGGDFTFSAMVGGMGDQSPEAEERREIVREVFFTYARDKVV